MRFRYPGDLDFDYKYAERRLCSFEAVAAATIASGAAQAALGAELVGASAAVAGAGAATTSVFSFANAFSFASGISSLAGGLIQGNVLDAQAELEGIRAQQELLIGQQDIVNQKEDLLQILAAFRARQGASGGGVSSGSSAVAQREAIQAQEDQTDITRSGARIRALTRRANTAVLRTRAGGARFGGIAGAVQSGFKAADRIERRG